MLCSPRLRCLVLACLVGTGCAVLGTRVTGAQPAPQPEAAAPPTDERVLHQLCRYLRLSREQVRQLLPVARYTGRAREQLEPERVQAQRRLDMLRAQPAEAERLGQWMLQREQKLSDDIAAVATPMVERVLTREWSAPSSAFSSDRASAARASRRVPRRIAISRAAAS